MSGGLGGASSISSDDDESGRDGSDESSLSSSVVQVGRGDVAGLSFAAAGPPPSPLPAVGARLPPAAGVASISADRSDASGALSPTGADRRRRRREAAKAAKAQAEASAKASATARDSFDADRSRVDAARQGTARETPDPPQDVAGGDESDDPFGLKELARAGLMIRNLDTNTEVAAHDVLTQLTVFPDGDGKAEADGGPEGDPKKRKRKRKKRSKASADPAVGGSDGDARASDGKDKAKDKAKAKSRSRTAGGVSPSRRGAKKPSGAVAEATGGQTSLSAATRANASDAVEADHHGSPAKAATLQVTVEVTKPKSKRRWSFFRNSRSSSTSEDRSGDGGWVSGGSRSAGSALGPPHEPRRSRRNSVVSLIDDGGERSADAAGGNGGDTRGGLDDGSVPMVASNKVEVTAHRVNEQEFGFMHAVQRIPAHTGPVWAMAFNLTGRYLATGGQDGVLRVWVLNPDPQPYLTEESAAASPAGGGDGGGGGGGSGTGTGDNASLGRCCLRFVIFM